MLLLSSLHYSCGGGAGLRQQDHAGDRMHEEDMMDNGMMHDGMGNAMMEGDGIMSDDMRRAMMSEDMEPEMMENMRNIRTMSGR